MRAERSVPHYTTGTLLIHFPNGEVCCRNCPLLTWRKNIRYECALTAEILIYPEDSVGSFCPIQFPKEEVSAP